MIGRCPQLREPMEETLRRSEKKAQRLSKESEILSEIGRIISSKLAPEDVYERVVSTAKEILPFDRVTIGIIQKGGNSACLEYVFGLPKPGWKAGDLIPVADLIPEEALKNRPVFMIHSENSSEPMRRPLPEAVTPLRDGFRSIMRVPFASHGRVIGILSFLSLIPNAYEDRDRRIAETIGAQIAGVVVNSQLSQAQTQAEEVLRQIGRNVLGLGLERTPLDEIGRIISSTINISGTYERFAEEKIKESEERYRLLFENSPLGIISVDLHGNIIEVNPVFLKVVESPSREATMAINVFNYPCLVEAGISEDFRRCLETGQPGIFERKYASKRGQEIYLRYHLTPVLGGNQQMVGVQVVMEDISEQKKLETQLLQAQKMEAIGTLAGGIAHDFNNILTAIIGYSELAAFDIPGTRTEYKLRESIKASHRAKDLVNQILAFSRRGEIEKKPMAVEPIVKESLKLLRASLPSTIQIQQFIESDSGTIQGNPTQVHQIIMNLCTNAAQAMEVEGGILGVHLHKVEVNEEMGPKINGLTPGSYISLNITDTGQGVPPEILDKIFEPYFTTKEIGKGTGLGLAVVHGIVKNHGGAITVQSQVGQGTDFKVYLPVLGSEKATEEDLREMPLPMGNQQRVLFVDDEEALADVAQQMLKYLGYEVEVRTSSQEALELFKEDPTRFDLVITDMTMPKMTGDRLAREMLQLRKDLPIILCTGYNERITEKRAKELGVREFMLKPLVIGELARTIRKVLPRKEKE